jgi:uncharacterized protein (TIGR02271 family)
MARKENTFIGVFDNQAEVLSKVAELMAQGHSESDMYVVGRDHDSFSTVHNQTGIHVDATNEKKNQGFMGKVMSALSGDSSLAAFNGMGLDRYEAKEYYEQVQNGKLVLYVDSDYGDTYERYGTNASTDYSNSSGIDESAPIETGATFAPDSTAGSAQDTDNTSDSSNAANLSGSPFEAGGLTGTSGSIADADSDFGKSITANGGASRPTSSTMGDSQSSASHNGSLSGSASGTTESTDAAEDRLSGSAPDTDRTPDSAGGSTSSTAGDAFDSASGITEEERLRLHEERLSIDKERVQTGEVNVGKHVVEENRTVEIPVEREEVYVERRPVDEETAGGEAFEENDTIHVPVSEERVNISKKDMVSEEIIVGKRKVQDTEQVNETVRREVADIDEDTTEGTNENNSKRR